MPARLVILASTIALLLSSVICFPSVLDEVVGLDWYAGNVRNEALTASVLFFGLAVLVFLSRDRLSQRLCSLHISRQHLLFGLITITLSVILALGVFEIVLRLIGQPFTGTRNASQNAIAQFDPELGWTYIPNLSTEQQFGSARRHIPMHFDGIGARVAALSSITDASRPTILFVGGSFTFGHGVTYDESFAGQIAATADFSLQVVNLGVQAYGTDQSMLRLKRHLPQFNVKAVVYSFICDHIRRNWTHDRRILLNLAK